MLEAERKYGANRDLKSMNELLCFYTDCVNYFELEEEAISEYFQAKIKELMKQIKQFGTHELAEKNR